MILVDLNLTDHESLNILHPSERYYVDEYNLYIM